jgi:hypothetical protein
VGRERCSARSGVVIVMCKWVGGQWRNHDPGSTALRSRIALLRFSVLYQQCISCNH